MWLALVKSFFVPFWEFAPAGGCQPRPGLPPKAKRDSSVACAKQIPLCATRRPEKRAEEEAGSLRSEMTVCGGAYVGAKGSDPQVMAQTFAGWAGVGACFCASLD